MRVLSATLAVGLSGSLACAPMYERSTEIRLRDPARVSLRSPNGDVLLPEGAQPASVPVGQGTFPTGESTSGDYAVRVVRAEGGALSYEVDTRIGLSTGEHLQIVHPDGKLVNMSPALVPQVDGPTFFVPMCGRLVQVHSRYRTGIQATHGERCSGRAMYGGDLAIPQDNLLSVRRIERGGNSRLVGWILFGTLAVPLALGGAVVTIAGSSAGETTETWLGVGLLAATAVTVLALLPWILAPDTDTQLHPHTIGEPE